MNNRMKRRVQNRVMICVDSVANDDVSGRVITQYNNEPIVVVNSMQIIKAMEDMYDKINFPQSSVRMREFGKKSALGVFDEQNKPLQVRTSTEILEFKGEIATFAVDVTSRQNATWQGVIYWLEEDTMKEFASLMDMLVLIDSATN